LIVQQLNCWTSFKKCTAAWRMVAEDEMGTTLRFMQLLTFIWSP